MKKYCTRITILLLSTVIMLGMGVVPAFLGYSPVSDLQAAPLYQGCETFLCLTDTPSSYSGQGERLVQVVDGEDEISFTSGLVWDNGNDRLGIGIAVPASKAHIYIGDSGRAPNANTALFIEDSDHTFIELAAGATSWSGIYFSDSSLARAGRFEYDHTNRVLNLYNNAHRLVLDSSGNVGIQDTTPSYELDVAGTIRAQEDLRADVDLLVANDATISHDAHVMNNLFVQESSALYGDVAVGGITPANVTVANGDVTVASGNVTATDVIAINDLRANDDLYVIDDATISGEAEIVGGLVVGQEGFRGTTAGRDLPGSNITATGQIYAYTNVEANQNLVAGLDLAVGDDATIGDYLDVNGSATFGDDTGGPYANTAVYGYSTANEGRGVVGEAHNGIVGYGDGEEQYSLAGGFFSQDVWVDQTLFVSNSGASDQGAEAGKGNLIIGQSHDLPYGPLTGAAALYVNSGELYVLDAYSNTTQLSPHNADGDWIFYSVDADGNVTYINMIEVIMAMEELTGREFIHDAVPEGEKQEYVASPSRLIPQVLSPATLE